jgi:hypothetical protein
MTVEKSELQLPAINVMLNGNVFITVAFTSNVSPTWTSLGIVIIFSSLTPVTSSFTKSFNVEIDESSFDCA